MVVVVEGKRYNHLVFGQKGWIYSFFWVFNLARRTNLAISSRFLLARMWVPICTFQQQGGGGEDKGSVLVFFFFLFFWFCGRERKKKKKKTDLALGKTESTLIEVDAEQLHKTLLIGGETDDLTDEITGESSALTKTL